MRWSDHHTLVPSTHCPTLLPMGTVFTDLKVPPFLRLRCD